MDVRQVTEPSRYARIERAPGVGDGEPRMDLNLCDSTPYKLQVTTDGLEPSLYLQDHG